MKDLNKSPFFDKRLIPLVQKILFFQESNASIISGFEKSVLKRSDEIRKLDNSLDRKLINLLSRVQRFTPLEDVLFFLLESQKRDQVEDAREALEAIISEEFLVDKEGLKEIFRKGKEMPMSWAVTLYGDEGAERQETPSVNKSSIDLSKLRNFK